MRTVKENAAIILLDLQRPKKTPPIVFQASRYSFHFTFFYSWLDRSLIVIGLMALVQAH